jgi:hypothetical protein
MSLLPELAFRISPRRGGMFIETAEAKNHKLQGSEMFFAFD